MNPQPNLFILGAPKCGTSSLAKWLSFHNDVFLPVVKEPHYYNTDENYRFFTSKDDYLKLYELGFNHHYRLDASTWYLHSQEAVKNILNDCPDSKFIVCIRNPVDMAFSLHNHFLNVSSREDESSFRVAWAMSGERLAGKSTNRLMVEPKYLAYKYSCRLGTQCERLLRLIPRSQVHFVIFDEIIRSPEETLKKLLCFLDLPEKNELSLPHSNKAVRKRSLTLNRAVRILSGLKSKLGISVSFRFLSEALERFNSVEEKYQIDPDDHAMVTEYFREEIVKISELTGFNNEDWLIEKLTFHK